MWQNRAISSLVSCCLATASPLTELPPSSSPELFYIFRSTIFKSISPFVRAHMMGHLGLKGSTFASFLSTVIVLDGNSSGFNQTQFRSKSFEQQKHDVEIDSCVFRDCDSFNHTTGGAICVIDHNIVIMHTIFHHNHATFSGGAISSHYSPSIHVGYCQFQQNLADDFAGALSCYLTFDVNITFCNFTSNSARRSCGAISFTLCQDISISDSLIISNEAKQNGGIFVNFGNVSLSHSVVAFSIGKSAFFGSGEAQIYFNYDIFYKNEIPSIECQMDAQILCFDSNFSESMNSELSISTHKPPNPAMASAKFEQHHPVETIAIAEFTNPPSPTPSLSPSPSPSASPTESMTPTASKTRAPSQSATSQKMVIMPSPQWQTKERDHIKTIVAILGDRKLQIAVVSLFVVIAIIFTVCHRLKMSNSRDRDRAHSFARLDLDRGSAGSPPPIADTLDASDNLFN